MNKNLHEKIQYVTTLSGYLLTDWYNANKKDALHIVSTLEHLPLARDRRGCIKFRQAIWHYANNIFEPVTCKRQDCSNPVKWSDTKHCYQQFCSNACVHDDGSFHQKQKQTNKARYGVDNIFEQKEYIKERRTQIFGVPHANQNTDVRNKTKQIFKQKYGVDHPWKDPTIRKKSVNTRYATDQHSSLDHHTRKHLQSKKWLYDQLVTNNQTQQQVANELNIAQSTVGLYAFKHGIDSQQRSKIQAQITEFIRDNYTDQVQTNIKGILDNKQELDIVLPDIALAIEVNGIFWHSELNGKTKKYHQCKLNNAFEKGYTLLMINDIEWYQYQNIVKSRIKSHLNCNQRIYARQTVCKPIDSSTYKTFINQNHIQQYVPASIRYGLFYNQQLVAVMSFGASRYNDCQYELLRYCCVCNHNVVGGPSKLFKHFVQDYQPQTVVSFGDRRWGNGLLYSKLGFEFINNTTPNYYYFQRNNTGYNCQLYSRVSFQKHKLHKKLNYFDPQLTEWQNMINNGYDRIWDCGSSKWIWYAGK